MARTLGRILLCGAAALLATAVSAGRVAAEPPGPEPAWARAVREGVATQDREISRSSIGAVITQLENAVARNHDDVVTLYLLARAYGKKGAAKDAIQTYGEVIQKEPGLWFAWHDRGVLSFRAARTDPATGKAEPAEDKQAVADLAHAIALKPDYVQALQDLAEIHLLALPPRPGAAIPLLKQALDADPGLDAARIQLALALKVAGRYPEALDTLKPLLSKQPKDPRARMVQGDITAAQGNVKEAQEIFKQLALDNPASPDPLREWLRVTRQAPTFDPNQMIWILERLRRLVRTEKEKKDITDWITKINSAVSRPQTPGGPPTTAQLAALLRGADAKKRDEVLQYLGSKDPDKPRVEGDLVLALIERLDPEREPDATNRLRALVSFEGLETAGVESPGKVFAALVRASLFDPDTHVREKVPDVLASFDNRASIPALLQHAKKTGKGDEMFAASARSAVYHLARSEAPIAADTPEAQAQAFAEWWASPERAALKRQVITDALGATDPTPEKVLILLAFEADPGVYVPAYRALLKVAEDLPKDPPTVAPEQRAALERKRARDAWLRAIPRLSDADLAAERREAAQDALLAWFQKSPR